MEKQEVKEIQNISKDSVKKLMAKSGWSRFTLFFIIAILLWNTFQIWMVSGVVSRVDKYNQGVVDEVGGLVGDVKLFAGDLNEIRKFLLLPEKNYSVDQGTPENIQNEENKESDNAVALYAFLDSVVKDEKLEKNREAARPVFGGLLADVSFQSQILESKLQLGERSDLQVKFFDGVYSLADGKKNELYGQPLYNLVFDSDSNLFKIQSALGEEKFSDYSKPEFFTQVSNYLIKNLEKVRAKKIQSVLDAKQAEDKAKLAVEQELEKKKQELEGLVKDKAFVETLAGIGLKVAEKPREEVNKYIFDVLDQAGKVKFSLVLEVSSGMIKVLQDNQELDIKSFLEDGSKKKI